MIWPDQVSCLLPDLRCVMITSTAWTFTFLGGTGQTLYVTSSPSTGTYSPSILPEREGRAINTRQQENLWNTVRLEIWSCCVWQHFTVILHQKTNMTFSSTVNSTAISNKYQLVCRNFFFLIKCLICIKKSDISRHKCAIQRFIFFISTDLTKTKPVIYYYYYFIIVIFCCCLLKYSSFILKICFLKQ